MSIQEELDQGPRREKSVEECAIDSANDIIENYLAYLSGERPDGFAVSLVFPEYPDEYGQEQSRYSKLHELQRDRVTAGLGIRPHATHADRVVTSDGVELFVRIHSAEYERAQPVAIEYSTSPFATPELN